ncbi:hypothetical protein GCM10027563_31140 [Parasphingorhabdus pacifica]
MRRSPRPPFHAVGAPSRHVLGIAEDPHARLPVPVTPATVEHDADLSVRLALIPGYIGRSVLKPPGILVENQDCFTARIDPTVPSVPKMSGAARSSGRLPQGAALLGHLELQQKIGGFFNKIDGVRRPCSSDRTNSLASATRKQTACGQPSHPSDTRAGSLEFLLIGRSPSWHPLPHVAVTAFLVNLTSPVLKPPRTARQPTPTPRVQWPPRESPLRRGGLPASVTQS